MKESKAEKAEPKREWWLLTGGFMNDPLARLYSGPYSTDQDAFAARVTIEKLRGANDIWVDSRPAVDSRER